MRRILKKIAPHILISAYHYLWAIFAAAYYGWPSRKMAVIGVTGTKGKTSTANFIWSCLNSSGLKTGLIGTANIRIGHQEWFNKYHMTMPGRLILQGLLAQMVKAGCKYCIVETTSEGIKQWRHKGISYDMAAFTNLTPEHLEAHGSFEAYKKTKGKLFASLAKSKHKIISGQKIKKLTIVNNDSSHADYFLSFKADKKITFGFGAGADYTAENIKADVSGVDFEVGSEEYHLNIMGIFNVYNALPAIVIGREIGLSADAIRRGLADLKLIPGRMELIDEGQDFTVIVDYAHEKESMMALLETAVAMRSASSKIIILLGAEGGGRDKAKRPVMGELAAKTVDVVIVSNVDPYDDDPRQILEDIAAAAERSGKSRDTNLFVIEDRRLGIVRALELARSGDIVLITGKGAEQSMIIKGHRLEWDDREVVREEIRRAEK
ncbi:MAG: UDP-N-acetylmuramoyl-L-alanyl-D-glutamate--2,6-diaminopimelate ligase [Parcubacteria group bacterium]|nr:UDP-N-acetylmuramoyl-L-alanyl-D-glutamate--2,6-diaminopimelate ligase [Parcubacteria group bacterium]